VHARHPGYPSTRWEKSRAAIRDPRHRKLSPADQPVEVVERKGIGHPDTLADALAERLSVAYSRHCRERYGAVLHHNLDKLYIRGGHARTAPGVFEMTEPTTVVIGGRVSTSFGGEPIDYRGLFDDVVISYPAAPSTWLPPAT